MNIENIQINTNDESINYIKDKISNIKNPRIKNELNCYYSLLLGIQNRHYNKFIDETMYNKIYLIDIYINNNIINVYFNLSITPHKNTIVNIEFNTSNKIYPWYCPNIKLINIEYIQFLMSNKPFFDFLNKINFDNICLCCSSITCRNNWQLTYNINNILTEIYENLNIKSRYMDHIMCKYITNHFFGHYLPIDTFL